MKRVFHTLGYPLSLIASSCINQYFFSFFLASKGTSTFIFLLCISALPPIFLFVFIFTERDTQTHTANPFWFLLIRYTCIIRRNFRFHVVYIPAHPFNLSHSHRTSPRLSWFFLFTPACKSLCFFLCSSHTAHTQTLSRSLFSSSLCIFM